MNPEQIETVYLPAIKHAAMVQASGQMLGEVELATTYLGEAVAVRMQRQVYSHRLADWEQVVVTPVNWWQHLRSQLGLSFKTRREYAHVIRSRTFPDLPYLHPTLGFSYLQEDVLSRYEPKEES